ncbi:MAG: TetR/AcrR family transcriptional regulator [Actinomycetota bacterium]
MAQRRTQTERSAATRARLCAAAIESLAERGYAGATTADIAARAGCSQGALFRHYPTKADLFADAAEALYDDVREVVRARLESAGEATDAVAASVRALWDVFRLPSMTASYELVMAARTDPALREALRPVLERNTAANVTLAAGVLPQGLATPGIVNLVIWAIQGAAMDAFVGVVDQEVDELIQTIATLARALS